ncbi:MAG: hypothetical protein HC813_01795 [Planctomycetes bacterium]|nr:hypothetical protein [Planctomycetota bacterium]
MTHPDPAVDAALSGSFVGLKINLAERHPDFKEAAGGSTVPWAPTFRYSDPKGREIRRTVGWFDVGDYLAELGMARGLGEIGRGRFAEALTELDAIAAGESRFAPEAAYYGGVAAFLGGKRDMALLKERWNRLRADRPGHEWAQRAAVVEDLP